MENNSTEFPFKEETLLIELKKEWYWIDDNKKMDQLKQQLIGEFLRDIVALFNTIDFENPKKLIIGFDEKTMEVDQSWKKVKFLQSHKKLRGEIAKKINNNFEAYPKNYNFRLENFFNFDEECGCLIINIEQAPFLLVAKEVIVTKKAKELDDRAAQGKISKGECLVRIKDQNNAPITDFLNLEQREVESKKLEKKIKCGFFAKYEKKISIEKIVDFYKKTTMPKGEKKPFDAPDGCVCFTVKYYNNFAIFFYLSNLATQKEGIDFLKNLDLKSATEIHIFVDSKNKYDKKTKIADNIISSIPCLKDRRMLPKTVDDWVDSFCREALEKFSEIINYSTPSTLFIESYVQEDNEETKGGLETLNSWIEDDGSPALIVRGAGGIGKTTLLKKFLSRDNFKFKKTIVQITSKFVDSLEKKESITLLNLCEEALKDIQDKHEEHEGIIDLALSTGKILLVIDGLDEIASKLNRKLDIDNFFKSIETYFLEFFKIKILITCRYIDNWKLPEYIRTVELKEFSEQQIDEYFDKCSVDKKTRERFKKRYKREGMEEIRVIPYILDLLRDKHEVLELIQNNDNFPRYLSKEDHDDCVIAKLCDREAKKHGYNTFSTEKQIEIFIKIATVYSGSTTNKHMEDLAKNESKDSLLQILSQHPILRQNGEQYVFRYEFWNLKFKVFSLLKQIDEMRSGDDIRAFDSNFQDLFLEIENNELTNYFKQKQDKNIDNLKLNLIEWIKGFDITKSRDRSFNSKFFLFLLSIVDGDINSNTQLLEEIYIEESVVKKMCIIGPTKIRFHFENKVFSDCHFNEYEDFLRCHFNQETRFTQCEFNRVVGKQKNKYVTKELFDLESCQIDKEFRGYLGCSIDPFIEIFEYFYNGISFLNGKIDKVKQKWGKSPEFKKLLEYGVIQENEETFTYCIGEQYQDFIKNIEKHGINHPLINKIRGELND